MATPHPFHGDPDVLEVSVPVATVWTGPEAPRDVDAAAVANPPDVAGWAASMDAQVRKGLNGRTLTQLLMGEAVRVLRSAETGCRWPPSGSSPPSTATAIRAGYAGRTWRSPYPRPMGPMPS